MPKDDWSNGDKTVMSVFTSSAVASSSSLVCTTILLFFLSIQTVDAIQCYSCKGSGPNEVEANIRCLESAYLENCDDFYQYYSEVENAKVLSYEYYYYDDGLLGPEDGEIDDLKYDDGEFAVGEDGERKATSRLGKSGDGDTKDEYEYADDGEYYYDYEDNRKKRNAALSASASGIKSRDAASNIVAGEKKTRKKRQIKSRRVRKMEESKMEDNMLDKTDGDKRGKEEEDIEYEYEYEEVEEYEYAEGSNSSTTTLPTVTDPSDESERPQPTMPKEPEHYCYSETKKDKWESYTVEKGCKKIMYCKEHLENRPEWSKPWNFCCDRARCNAKLVKDKPQRIFGMGCRRTDDCIQGYNSRPVCPNFFQACPRISTSLIKMECRVKSKTMASVKNAARFQHMFREKKCYCAKGYFPRGPICTSGSATTTSSLQSLISISIIISTLTLLVR